MSRLNELKPVTARHGQPLYVAVRENVREAIDNGVYAPGERLPSTKAMSEQMSVSLVTVHRALQELVANGVLRRGQGRGTFVHERYEAGDDLARGIRFGLVFHRESSLADGYHGQILEGVRQRADELGVDLVLLRFGEDWRNECRGYLYVNPFEDQLAHSPRFGSRLSTSPEGVDPAMVIGARFDHPGVSSVDTDNADISRQAVRLLARAHHEQVGYVGGGPEVSNNADRWAGFLAACHEFCVATDPAWHLRRPGWRLDALGNETLVEMLRRDDRPSAIFAAGYYYALDVYAAAEAAGLSIPSDLSVVAVDDPPSAAHLSPPLTTLRQPLVELGRLAAGGLFEIIAGEADLPRRTTLRAELVERASVAPPARAGAQRNGAASQTNKDMTERPVVRGRAEEGAPTNGSV